MHAAPGFVRAGVGASLRSFLARYPGVSAEDLVRRAGIDPAQLGNHEATLSSGAFVELLELAAKETGDPCFGLELGAQVQWKDIGVLGYLMLHSPTLGAGAENACRYLAVQQTSGTAALRVDGKRARLTYTVRPELGPSVQHVDSVLVVFLRYCREALGDPAWAPREVRVQRRAPAGPSFTRYRAAFGCPVQCAANENAVVFERSLLAAPARTADPGLFPILRKHADEVIARVAAQPVDVAGEVREAIALTLGSGDATIESVAKRLATSTRSLQRRLRDDGVSFQTVLADTRLALSRRYVADPALSLTDTALLLGYSDLSAFSRAFRRWTGTSPIEARRASTTAR